MKKHTYKTNKSLAGAQPSKLKRSQSGFSLIEIMVAAVILSIGVLGVVSLQIVGLKGTHQSYMKQQAMSIVQGLTERMRSNKQGVIAGDYTASNATVSCSATLKCNTSSATCSSKEIATDDLYYVMCGHKSGSSPNQGGVVNSLANGRLDITCLGGCATGDISINLRWKERQIGEETLATDADATTDSLQVTTRILP